MSMYIAGSIAYDRIMTFPGAFAEHLLPDRLHILNVCFLIDRVDLKRGGTAGNIAYSLALLGERPLILGAAGRDFALYETALKKLKLPRDGIRIVKDELTAAAFIITDQHNNQITAFSPSAMRFPCGYAFPALDPANDIALVGPGNLEDMVRLPAFFRERGIRYIFDPGQQIPALSGEELRGALTGAFACISNDYELELILKRTGLTQKALAGRVEWLITTLGGKGSRVHGARQSAIGIAEPRRTLDPTGAGDAYRAGLIKGIAAGLPAPEAAALGATCASFCVEHSGTQEHAFTKRSFLARHQKNFGPPDRAIF
ncbi:MAG: carbohydrate kinase family protein [Deltaproteobacteria bacterium]|nr:carbohydrate kinase family protein [Deltaproteobacteria bacterium]